MGARPSAKDFENEAGPVDDFRLPVPLEIALLHRAQGGIDNDNPDLVFFDQLAESVEGSRAEQAARPRARDAGDLRPDDIEADGSGETHRLLESGRRRASGNLCRLPPRRRSDRRMDNEGAAGRGPVRYRLVAVAAQDSAISLFGSKSWIGCP